MKAHDFTLQKYKELCLALLNNHYTPSTVRSYIAGRDSAENGKIAVLRHDIDRKIDNALRVAKLENGLGIRSSYYFRYPYTFDPETIIKIGELGHEIGYHYEVLSKANGDRETALGLFGRELQEFRRIADVATICMHGSPLSRYDNRDLWQADDFKKYGIAGDAYLSVNGTSYFSDTGRSWSRANKIRDHMPHGQEDVSIDTTEDLIRLVNGDKIKTLYILTHPERWNESMLGWSYSYVKDMAANAGKKALAGRYRYSKGNDHGHKDT